MQIELRVAMRLNFRCAWIGSLTKQKDTFFFIFHKRFYRVLPQIRRKRNSVGFEPLIAGSGVSFGCRANIAAFGIQNERDIFRNHWDDLIERANAFGAKLLKKSDIRFVTANQILGLLDQRLSPAQQSRKGIFSRREYLSGRIHPYAK